jgi:hypothetical protein
MLGSKQITDRKIMAKITAWDKFRNALGFGYSNKTVEAIKLETEILIENLRKQAAERVAKLNKDSKAKKPAAAKPKAEAKPAAKTPATKKPAPKKSSK